VDRGPQGQGACPHGGFVFTYAGPATRGLPAPPAAGVSAWRSAFVISGRPGHGDRLPLLPGHRPGCCLNAVHLETTTRWMQAIFPGDHLPRCCWPNLVVDMIHRGRRSSGPQDGGDVMGTAVPADQRRTHGDPPGRSQAPAAGAGCRPRPKVGPRSCSACSCLTGINRPRFRSHRTTLGSRNPSPALFRCTAVQRAPCSAPTQSGQGTSLFPDAGRDPAHPSKLPRFLVGVVANGRLSVIVGVTSAFLGRRVGTRCCRCLYQTCSWSSPRAAAAHRPARLLARPRAKSADPIPGCSACLSLGRGEHGSSAGRRRWPSANRDFISAAPGKPGERTWADHQLRESCPTR